MDDGDKAGLVWQATIAAALARRGAAMQAAGLVIGLVGAVSGIHLSLTLEHVLAAVIALAQIGLVVAGLVVGARTALDADLFRALARSPDPAGFDAAMLILRLMPPDKAGRPVGARVAGLMRLLRWQAACVALQLALLAPLVLLAGFG